MTPAVGARRYRVGLVAGCVQRVLFPEVNDATLRVLAAEGCEVVVPSAGLLRRALDPRGPRGRARDMARALLEAFEGEDLDAILVNAAGCGSNLKDYGRILAGDPAFSARAAAFAAKVKDVTEFLAAIPPVAERRPIAKRVAYHDSCHLAHAQRVKDAPRRAPLVDPRPHAPRDPRRRPVLRERGDLQPRRARERRRDRPAEGRRTCAAAGADLLASANPGCTLQIATFLKERGAGLPVFHPVEILAASLEGRDPGA